jgi:hypothetical protein
MDWFWNWGGECFEYREGDSLWRANCYFSSHRACNIACCRRVSAGCTGGR